jgi:7-cyano-7-deazaguanine reductase
MSERIPWSSRSSLKAISNPTRDGYEIKIKTEEITFLGVKEQPDFAQLFLTMYPGDRVIELRSLKRYLYEFRDVVISYERLVNVIYDDLMAVYEPQRLRIVMILNARGGISSRLTIDSDWGVRGGQEQFKDWVGQKEEW